MSFVNLHNHSSYSLLDGAITPTQMAERAKELGQNAVAITDHGNMHGVIKFYQEARQVGIKPIIGCEVYIAPGSRLNRENSNSRPYHLVLLAKNDKGYHNLIQLVKCGSFGCQPTDINVDGRSYSSNRTAVHFFTHPSHSTYPNSPSNWYNLGYGSLLDKTAFNCYVWYSPMRQIIISGLSEKE